MRRVFGLGETVLDIIFKDDQPVSAKAGGSVLNTLVSLARMGHQCYFISELGKDKVGNNIVNFLEENKLNTKFIQRYNNGQSSLAMAFLNDNNDAEYDFYKNYPQERLTDPLPDFNPDDIFIFGSTYSISPAIRPQVYNIVEHAHKNDCVIIYDPNFRNKHKENQDQYMSYLKDNFKFADIIRGSNEDFENIYSTTSSEQAFTNLQNECSNLIYTASSHGVFAQSSNVKKHYQVPTIKPISTIGAGDNFNAGIIHGIISKNITKKDLSKISEENWDYLIDCGIQFSSAVCMSLDNYVPVGFLLS